MKREAIVFYKSFDEAISLLSDDDQLEAYRAITRYGLYGEEPEITGAAGAIFLLAKPQIDANNRRYENGNRGGRPKKLTDEQVKEGSQLRNKGAYKKWREEVLKRNKSRCAVCGSTTDVVAHHIKGVHEYPEGWYEVDNGIALCRDCHSEVHKDNRRLSFNDKKSAWEITYYKPEDNLTLTESKPKEKEKDKEKDKVKDNKHNVRSSAQIDSVFETVWQAYPEKKGKGRVSDKDKRKIAEVGIEKMLTAISRYKKEVDGSGWKHYQNGNTFFHSGYLDYLDENYEPSRQRDRPASLFNNTPTRDYDMEELERKLLATN